MIGLFLSRDRELLAQNAANYRMEKMEKKHDYLDVCLDNPTCFDSFLHSFFFKNDANFEFHLKIIQRFRIHYSNRRIDTP